MQLSIASWWEVVLRGEHFIFYYFLNNEAKERLKKLTLFRDLSHFNKGTEEGTNDIPVPEWLRIDLGSYVFPSVISKHFKGLLYAK